MKYIWLSIILIGIPSLVWAWIRLEEFYGWLLIKVGFPEDSIEGTWILTIIAIFIYLFFLLGLMATKDASK